MDLQLENEFFKLEVQNIAMLNKTPVKTAVINSITVGSFTVWFCVKWTVDSCGFKKAMYMAKNTNSIEKKICFNDKVRAP